MPNLTLTKTRLFEGVWEGVLSYDGDGNYQPEIEVTHLQKPLRRVQVRERPGGGAWELRIPVPVELISDGVQTFVICDKHSGEMLDNFSLIAGEALGHDIRAEVALLRDELDMLKRAFRRHCLESG